VRAVFPNPDHVLLPGMFVRARIDQGVDNTAMLVPQVGVTHNPQGQATALVVGPDNKVELRTIQASRTSGADWVVDGGLKDGERVIVSGVQKVQPEPWCARSTPQPRNRSLRRTRYARPWPSSSSTARSSRSS